MKRRDFLQQSSFILAAAAAPSLAFNSKITVDPLRIGIIGTGQRGTGLASVIQKIPGISLMAGADVLDFRLKDCMENYGDKNSRSYSDYRRILDDKSIDAVIISTPLYLHHQVVSDALDAGKHIYCEKTMAFSVQQSLDIAARLKSTKGLIFKVGYQYRDYPLYHEVKNIIDKGWLGQLQYFETFYNRNNDWRRPLPNPGLERQINWRMYKEYSGGLMAELSSHQVDIVNWFTRSHPQTIMGLGDIGYWKDGRETYDHINLVATYANGISGQITSHIANAHMGYSIKFMGTEGAVEVNFDKAYFYKEEGKSTKQKGIMDGVSGATLKMEPGKAFQIPVSIKSGYSATTYSLEAFAQSIRDNTQPISNIESGTMASVMVSMANMAMDNKTIESWKPTYNLN